MTDIAFPNIGISISNLPKGITISGFTIAFYGMIIALGMVLGLLLAMWQAKRTKQDSSIYSDYMLFGVIFSIIGARLYFVIFSLDDYKDNWLQVFNLRNGGLAIYGGIIAAIITAIIFCKKKKYSFFLFADTAMPGLLLGQILGRWGNFFNREAFGEYTDSLFAMQLRVDQVNPSYITQEMKNHIISQGEASYIQVHPTFLYESVWNLLVLIAMLLLTKHKKFKGEFFLMYIVFYGIGRAWIEGLRTDQLLFAGTNIAVSQILSIVIAAVGIISWIFIRVKIRKK